MEKLNPQYVRGLIDAEGCFSVLNSSYRSNRCNFRFYNKNLKIVKALKDFFRDAYIYENSHGSNKDVHELVMQSKNQLRILIEFFEENGMPIVKETNRPRNVNSVTTFKDWYKVAKDYAYNGIEAKKYDQEIKEKAIVMRQNGYTLKEISESLGPSISSIHKWTS